MCGIFGCVFAQTSGFSTEIIQSTIRNMYIMSETRGKEASGLATRCGDVTYVHRAPIPASSMIERNEFKTILSNVLDKQSPNSKESMAIIGHARLMTNGMQGITTNNQPVVKDNVVGIHNGIVVNVDELWNDYPELEREFDVDTEVVVALLRHYLKLGESIPQATRHLFNEIVGTASISILLDNPNCMLLASNTGSLFKCTNKEKTATLFVSEKFILQQLLQTPELSGIFEKNSITQMQPGQGVIIDLNDSTITEFDYADTINEGINIPTATSRRTQLIDTYYKDIEARDSIRRCSKCVLPETFPFIEFDAQGVCNYCHTYSPIEYKGADVLDEIASKFRKGTGEADCIIAFSGGRDSSYCLHYAKEVLGLSPIAYTYDWGMVNDLARRNQARVTGKLGVEQILVSADIKRKRKNISKNVAAWLKKPDLGMVPLFMAGDKQFFYYANQLKQKTGIEHFMWAENQLERTNFKTGFCGIPTANSKKRIYNMSLVNKARMGMYYMKNFAKNPSYINTSMIDTAFAYISYYMIPHNYLWFFDYLPFKEEMVDNLLINEYKWEIDPECNTTWRIGDGTAAFYNFIYYTAAGFTENDTFRSNQIREGLISREKALELIHEENKPRMRSIQEYLQLINLDFDEAMASINSMPRLYTTQC